MQGGRVARPAEPKRRFCLHYVLCGLGILRIIEDDDDAVVAGFPDEVVL